MASTTRDSTLDLIRGEISKLREELEAAKLRNTPLTSTPRRYPVVENRSMDEPPEGASLQAIRDDIKVNIDLLFENKQKHNFALFCVASLRLVQT